MSANILISGLRLWLRGGVGMFTDTAGTTPATTEGDAVARWDDTQSGSGLSLTQATSLSRPRLRGEATRSLDFRLNAYGDESNDSMSGGTALQFGSNAGLTVIAAVNQVAVGSANYGIVARDASGNRGYSTAIEDADGKAILVIASSSTTRVRRNGSKIDLRGMPAVLTFRYDGGAGEQSIRANGAADTGTIDAAVPATIGGNGATLQILNNGFGEPFGGHLADLIVYDRALSDSERDAIEDELKARYGLLGLSWDSTGPDTGCHQGYSTDGTRHYTFDDALIQRRDPDWSVLASNSSPFTGLIADTNHLGDGAYFGGKLYLPAERYASVSDFGSQQIAVYDAVTLALVDSADISAQAHEVSALAIDAANDRIYVSSYADGTQLFLYKLSDLSYVGTLTLSNTISFIQGLAYRAGYLYASVGRTTASITNGCIWRIDAATGSAKVVYHDAHASGTVHEGLDFSQDELRWLVDAGSGEQKVRYLTALDDAGAAPDLEPPPPTLDDGDDPVRPIPRNTATAALRRIPFSLVDATDLFTPEDITVTGVKPTLSVGGAAGAAATNDIVKVDGSAGEYHLELTQAEVDVAAYTTIRGWLAPTGCALTKFAARIVPANDDLRAVDSSGAAAADVVKYDGRTAVPTLDAGGTTSVTLAADEPGVDDAYNDYLIEFVSGPGAGQWAIISDYAGGTKVATLDRTLAVAVDGTTKYALTYVPAAGLDAADMRAALGLASANLDDQLATIDGVADAILADTGTDGVVVASGSKSGYSLAADQSGVTIGTVNALDAAERSAIGTAVLATATGVTIDTHAATVLDLLTLHALPAIGDSDLDTTTTPGTSIWTLTGAGLTVVHHADPTTKERALQSISGW